MDADFVLKTDFVRKHMEFKERNPDCNAVSPEKFQCGAGGSRNSKSLPSTTSCIKPTRISPKVRNLQIEGNRPKQQGRTPKSEVLESMRTSLY